MYNLFRSNKTTMDAIKIPCFFHLISAWKILTVSRQDNNNTFVYLCVLFQSSLDMIIYTSVITGALITKSLYITLVLHQSHACQPNLSLAHSVQSWHFRESRNLWTTFRSWILLKEADLVFMRKNYNKKLFIFKPYVI